MRLTETLSAGGATATAAMLLATVQAAQKRADAAAARITALECELALLERDVGLPEHTQAGNRAEPV